MERLRQEYWDGTSVVRLRRKGEIVQPGPEDHLELGDELLILAPVEYFTDTIAKIGEEVVPIAGAAQATGTARIVVIDKNDKVVYTELVPEIAQEPDYDAALRAVS